MAPGREGYRGEAPHTLWASQDGPPQVIQAQGGSFALAPWMRGAVATVLLLWPPTPRLFCPPNGLVASLITGFCEIYGDQHLGFGRANRQIR